MKKTINIFGIVLILVGSFACKKGENDPFVSLRTRKARLCGEWKVTHMESQGHVEFGVTNFDVTSSYDGSTEIQTTSTSTNTMSYTKEYTFEKDGTFKMVKNETVSGSIYTSTEEGNWVFLGKSKSAELKNKEAICLSYTKLSDGSGEVDNISGTFFPSETLIIDQLKEKEIVIAFDLQEHYYGGENFSKKGKIVLTKK